MELLGLDGLCTNIGCSYMSKAPDSVQDYDGSDGWRKLYDWGTLCSLGGRQAKFRKGVLTCVDRSDYSWSGSNLMAHGS